MVISFRYVHALLYQDCAERRPWCICKPSKTAIAKDHRLRVCKLAIRVCKLPSRDSNGAFLLYELMIVALAPWIRLNHLDQVPHGVGDVFFPLPGRIGYRGSVALIRVRRGADSVWRLHRDRAPQAVVSVGSPTGWGSSRNVGLRDAFHLTQRRAGAGIVLRVHHRFV